MMNEKDIKEKYPKSYKAYNKLGIYLADEQEIHGYLNLENFLTADPEKLEELITWLKK